MNLKNITALTTACFFVFTSIGLCAENEGLQALPQVNLTAVGGMPQNITLGSVDPNSGFKFKLDLSTKGAAVSQVTMSEFDDRNQENLQPLILLSPAIKPNGSEALSMATETIVLPDQKLQLRLDKLDWNLLGPVKNTEDSERATFEAIVKDKDTNEPVIKMTKSYLITAGSYDVKCDFIIENLSPGEKHVYFNFQGPVGIGREDTRSDTRKAVAGFRNSQGQIVSSRLDVKKLTKAKSADDRRLVHRGAGFVWASIINKYFAAVIVPGIEPNESFCNWIAEKFGWFTPTESGSGYIGIEFKTTVLTLAPEGQSESSKNLNYQIYIGPKDKPLFDKNPMYKNLGFVQTIDFMACCCPSAIIYPLGFGILAMMKWMYGFIPNYGVVIIILVLFVRLILHPLTRKSQVSMSEYSKFNSLPEVQEIRKKYGKDMMEMNRHISELQKKHGISHSAMIMGMLPTLVQMPIWIALYGAIYASIDLRGASFLPFWITDLSAPDALFKFPGGFSIPYLGNTFNLLPILMGVAFYLQQMLMPSQAASSTPEAAQQQKLMKFLMPVMFPFMLYTSPSGLNLYIMASVFGGVFEQYIIKKHIQQKEEEKDLGLVAVTSKTGGKIKKKKPKPFFKI